jgi:hypothetical protein
MKSEHMADTHGLYKWNSSVHCCVDNGETQNFALVRLSSSSGEFQRVEESWSKSMAQRGQVTEIYRIQNKSLMRKFASVRMQMETDICEDGKPADLLQRECLWHGTQDVDNFLKITRDGFDRLFCVNGINAYGKGVGFNKKPHCMSADCCACVRCILRGMHHTATATLPHLQTDERFCYYEIAVSVTLYCLLVEGDVLGLGLIGRNNSWDGVQCCIDLLP